jgi:hypothetical protein
MSSAPSTLADDPQGDYMDLSDDSSSQPLSTPASSLGGTALIHSQASEVNITTAEHISQPQ